MSRGRDAGPLRTCLGCREVKPRAELLRLALRAGERGPEVVWDEGFELGGRGAWLCRGRSECLKLALKRRVFKRAFRLTAEPDLSALAGGREDDWK